MYSKPFVFRGCSLLHYAVLLICLSMAPKAPKRTGLSSWVKPAQSFDPAWADRFKNAVQQGHLPGKLEAAYAHAAPAGIAYRRCVCSRCSRVGNATPPTTRRQHRRQLGVNIERAGAWMRFSEIVEYTKSTSVSMLMIQGVPIRFDGDVLQYHVTLFIS